MLAADLVVCTRNRPVDLARLLASVAEQRPLPAAVVVVDSSDDDASGRVVAVVAAAAARWPAEIGAPRHLASLPGLPRQRNVGIDATVHDIVCFLDDDVVLEPGYFLAVGAAFAGDATGRLGGVGATIVDQPPRPRLWRLDALLGLDSAREGTVLRSGRNVRVYDSSPLPTGAAPAVDWLAGLAMSFRRAVFADARPDPSFDLEGEDVEFTYRVAQRWQLRVLPAARVRHLESGVGRPRLAETTAREVAVRHRRCTARTGRMRPWWFWLGIGAQLVRAALTAPVSREQRAIFVGTARGVGRIGRATPRRNPFRRRATTRGAD